MASAENDYLIPGTQLSITSLPKVSLHDHLDGGLRPETIIELADEAGVELPALEPHVLAGWFAGQADSGSLVDYLKTFDVTLSVMQTAAGLTRVAKEAVQDLHADGVVYGELRWAPEQHLAAGLSLEDAVDAVQAGIEAGIDDVASAGGRIGVGQLVTAMRHTDRYREIAELAVAYRSRGVVGFDIAGPEAGFPPSRMREAFDYLAEQSFPATVHAGEADGIDSIQSALIDGRALRLGHGVRIAEDIDLEETEGEATYALLGLVAQWVRDREIPLELSPSSNLQTGAIAAWGSTIEDHPFDLLYQLGFRVTVNTDNRLMSRTSLSRELFLLSEAFGYEAGDLEVFQLNAAAAAFLPLEERESLSERITSAFDQL